MLRNDSRSGKIVFQAKDSPFGENDSKLPSLAEITGFNYFHLDDFAFNPINGSLLICSHEFSYGPHAFVLSSDYRHVDQRIHIDGSLRGLSFSPDGKRLVTHGISNSDPIDSSEPDDELLCVSELSTGNEIVRRGKRVIERPEKLHFVIGPAYTTRLEHDGDDLLVGSVNGGCWSNGSFFVQRISTGNKQFLKSEDGSCQMDVDFEKKRVVVSKSKTSVSLVNLQLETIASLNKITHEGISHLEFSPDGSKILIAAGGIIKMWRRLWI